MWYSYNHQTGTRICSGKAYYLETIGEFLWVLGVALIIASLFICTIVGAYYNWQIMWIPLLPAGMIIISMFMRGLAQVILDKKGFRYDHESDTAWIGDEVINVPEEVKLYVPTTKNDQVEKDRKISEQENKTKRAHSPDFMRKIQGQEITKDFVEVCRQAAQQGNADAICNLGLMYMTGGEVPLDNEEALKWFQQAAEQGDSISQFCLGLMKLERSEENEEILSYPHFANKVVIEMPCLHESKLTTKIDIVNEDDQSATVEWFRLAAAQGLAAAQYNLGLMYEKGIGVTPDKKEAFKWYQLAAEQDDSVAQFCLGLMYMQGDGVEQDRQEAFKWFQRAAENGQPDAQNTLGVMYMQGDGVQRDTNAALMWFQSAYGQHSIEAAYNIGVMYLTGLGVKQDIYKAIELIDTVVNANDKDAMKRIKKLAECGYVPAQNYLGNAYHVSRPVIQDHFEAAVWYHLAAAQGAKNALENLTQLYKAGKGVKKDMQAKELWFRVLFTITNTLRIFNWRKVKSSIQKARSITPEEINSEIVNKLSCFCLPWDRDPPGFKMNQYFLLALSGICRHCSNKTGRIRNFNVWFSHCFYDQLCDQCYDKCCPYSSEGMRRHEVLSYLSGIYLGPFSWNDIY